MWVWAELKQYGNKAKNLQLFAIGPMKIWLYNHWPVMARKNPGTKCDEITPGTKDIYIYNYTNKHVLIIIFPYIYIYTHHFIDNGDMSPTTVYNVEGKLLIWPLVLGAGEHRVKRIRHCHVKGIENDLFICLYGVRTKKFWSVYDVIKMRWF